MPDSPKVFISYSHDSDEHRDRVRDLADRLRAEGLDVSLDQFEIDVTPRWMVQKIEESRFVLVVCTETYRKRFEGKESRGGLGADFEGKTITQEIYERRDGFAVPIFFEPDSGSRDIPKVLRGLTYYRLPKGYDALYRRLTDQHATPAGPVGEIRKMPPKARRFVPSPTSSAPSADPVPNDPLTRYRAWAEDHHSRLRMIGLDADDVQVGLDEIYVPLKVVDRGELGGADLIGMRGLGGRGEGSEEFEVREVFNQGDARHLLIFGEPGSGKTTALKKLHQLCWADPVAIGLEADTVPVFLQLRRLDRVRFLKGGLAPTIDREVESASGSLQGMGDPLWRHRRLLLLFDGLDEIADESERLDTLRHLSWLLDQPETASVRAVVSCRRTSLPKSEADPDRVFRSFEVRPLDGERVLQLVQLWFREMRKSGKLDQEQARSRVTKLEAALTSREHATLNILGLVSNPLLLTLLCVVALRGDEIPENRKRFYERCLDVLLDHWPRSKERRGPVDAKAATQVLSRLAFFLHRAGRRDNLRWGEAVEVFAEQLGDTHIADRFFDWCLEDVGILLDTGGQMHGFVHLGIQEFLTAQHLADQPGDMEVLEGTVNLDWWKEVFRHVSAISPRHGFRGLTRRLLNATDVLERASGLLADCWKEAEHPDPAAFVEVLDHDDDPEKQKAVLRLLRQIRDLPDELTEKVAVIARSSSGPLQAVAADLVELQRKPSSNHVRVTLIHYDARTSDRAHGLAQRLRDVEGGCRAVVAMGDDRATGKILGTAKAAVVLVGQDESWPGLRSLRKLFDDRSWLTVLLPGDPRAEIPDALRGTETKPWNVGEQDDLAKWILSRLPWEQARPRAADEIIENTTEEIFLHVPAGEFTMGTDEDLFTPEQVEIIKKQGWDWWLDAARPPFRAEISEFWLAKTPVTNRQYALFLAEAGDDHEPSEWRNSRFNGPEHPVVGVSWLQATAYCEWLTRRNRERDLTFSLPTEAQWEYAARGTESRRYPWGDLPEPAEELARFGKDRESGSPLPVGSFPKGAGPFGHLDLAGTVWEWCADLWDPSYEGREDGSLDPIGDQDESLRPLRGGGWDGPASVLRSAFRNGDRPGNRYDNFGFRVSCAPSRS